jgi:hypothetical protein
MRRTVLVVALALGGCMTGDPTGSTENAIIEGDWVVAPEVSDHPLLASELPKGVSGTPVDLVLTTDGILLVCDNGVPMSGYDATGTGGDEGGGTGDLPGVRPESEYNAPLSTEMGDDGTTSGAPSPSDAFGGGGIYDASQPFSSTNFQNMLPLPGNVFNFHAGCL